MGEQSLAPQAARRRGRHRGGAPGAARADPAPGLHGGTSAARRRPSSTTKAHRGRGTSAPSAGRPEGNGFDPRRSCATSTRARRNGVREWEIVAEDREIEVAPGRQVRRLDLQRPRARPDAARARGRAAAGPLHERLVAPAHDPLPRHPPRRDGRRAGIGAGNIGAGDSTVYEFDATPFGLHLYPATRPRWRSTSPRGSTARSSSTPRSRRQPADELVMVMNGSTPTSTAPTRSTRSTPSRSHYMEDPIRIRAASWFGSTSSTRSSSTSSTRSTSTPTSSTTTDRHRPRGATSPTWCRWPGRARDPRAALPYHRHFMFHAHQSEFAELGWMGFFEVNA